MPKFEREFGCDCEEGIVIESLFVIVGREKFPLSSWFSCYRIYDQLMTTFIYPKLLKFCVRNLFLAYCLTLKLMGFSVCWDFWKNLGTFLKLDQFIIPCA